MRLQSRDRRNGGAGGGAVLALIASMRLQSRDRRNPEDAASTLRQGGLQ